MSEEDNLLPISALQHMIFCDRQAALIHLERIWLDNTLTVEGSDLHRVVDDMGSETRGAVLIRRGLSLRSHRLGVTGKADVIEFHGVPAESTEPGCVLSGVDGRWRPFPVEYKRGRPKEHRADEVQLCAQAMCLEEALDVEVPAGALFYGQMRRRQSIPFGQELRELTTRTAANLHAMMQSRTTPVRNRQKKCDRCSLLPACLPPRRTRDSARAYVRRLLALGPPDNPDDGAQ